MASLGASMRKGQSAMVCQLCENDPKMKWKCVDCSLMMCNRCKEKVHPKFPGAEGHTILDLKDIGTSAQSNSPKLDFSKILCDSHAGQNCCLFCTKCDKLVCPSCVTQTHNKHDLIEISDAYNLKLDFLRERQTKIENKQEIINAGFFVLEEWKAREREKFVSVRQDILDYQQKLTEAFNKAKDQSESLITELDQKWSDIIISIGKESRRFIDLKSSIADQQEALDNLSNSKDVMKVFTEASNPHGISESDIKPIHVETIQIPKLEVLDIQIPVPSFQQNKTPYQLGLQLSSQLDTDFEEISNLNAVGDDTFWIRNSQHGISCTKLETGNLNTTAVHKQRALDIASNPHGDILIADGSSIVKILKAGDKRIIDSCFNFSPLKACSLYVRKDGYVIAGLCRAGDAFPVKGVRKVVMVNPTGKVEKEFVNDKSGKPMFSYPSKFATNQNNDIGLIDTLSQDYDGRFILLNQSGAIINMYTGHPDINGNNPFKPTNIICTPCDYFIISEYWNHQLIIFNNNGELIAYHSTALKGIAAPMSLCMTNPGQIYLGCKAKPNSSNKAKIYKLSNFPW